MIFTDERKTFIMLTDRVKQKTRLVSISTPKNVSDEHILCLVNVDI